MGLYTKGKPSEDAFANLKAWSDLVGVFTRMGFLVVGMSFVVNRIPAGVSVDDYALGRADLTQFRVLFPLLAWCFITLCLGGLLFAFTNYLLSIVDELLSGFPVWFTRIARAAASFVVLALALLIVIFIFVMSVPQV